jgi:hypothetical protein
MVSQTNLPDNDIIVTAESAAIAAIKEYENISQGSLYYLPEYWITCRIAADLASRGFIVGCEKRIIELLPAQRVNGRIDLAVYAATDGNGSRSLQALIEVKGPRTTWTSFPVAWLRLKMTSESLNSPGLLIGLVYGTENKTHAQLDAEEHDMTRWLPPAIVRRDTIDYLRTSERQHLQGRHDGITPDINDVWEVMSIFDRV